MSQAAENRDSLLAGFGKVKQIDKTLTPEEAISIIQKALQSWNNVQCHHVSVTNISAGYLNALWLVQRKDTHVEDKIIVRIYDGNTGSPLKKNDIFDHGFGRDLESTVALAASYSKIGPKVHMVTDTFRVEQFVESRNFKIPDYRDDHLLSEFARNLARFHSMIERPEFEIYRVKKADLFARVEDIFSWHEEKWPKVCDLARTDYRYKGQDGDFLKEFRQMKNLLPKLNLKYTLINWDLNTMNILVRNEVTDPDQLRTVLIDYEFAHYNLRCFDIGITASRLALQSAISGDKLFYTDEEIIEALETFENIFVRAYYEEYVQYSKDVDADGVDSWQNIVAESIFGACWTWMFSITNLLLFLSSLVPEEQLIHLLARKLGAFFQFHECAKAKLFQLKPELNSV